MGHVQLQTVSSKEGTHNGPCPFFDCLRYVDKVKPCTWPGQVVKPVGTKAVLPGAVRLGLQMDVQGGAPVR